MRVSSSQLLVTTALFPHGYSLGRQRTALLLGARPRRGQGPFPVQLKPDSRLFLESDSLTQTLLDSDPARLSSLPARAIEHGWQKEKTVCRFFRRG
jgi:hypothetical protein